MNVKLFKYLSQDPTDSYLQHAASRRFYAIGRFRRQQDYMIPAFVYPVHHQLYE